MTKAGPPLQNTPLSVPGLNVRVMQTRLALVWEMLWRGLWQPVCATGLFLSLSLFEFWRLVPALVHWFLLLSLIVLWAVTLLRLSRHFRLPDRHLILARIERVNGLLHQPLRALEDAQEADADDAQNLWRAHLRRLHRTLPQLKFVQPRPGAIRLDRHGLRQMAGILLIAGFLAAGSQWQGRIETGFMPAAPGPAIVQSRLEAWIAPPAYTGAAPVMLAGDTFNKLATGNTPDSPDEQAVKPPVTVPAGSELSLRLFGGRDAELLLTPDAGKKIRLPLTRIDNANSHTNVRLMQSGNVVLSQFGTARREWRINVIPDLPPQIRLLEDITVSQQYGLHFRYEAGDDYGVTVAGAEISLIAPGNAPAKAPLEVEFPALPRAAKGALNANVDLSAHLWAGKQVQLRLMAKDAAGQTGYSSPVTLILPQRPFAHPLARAIIEQRGIVAANPKQDGDVIRSLDALSLFPQRFTPELGVYLPMRVARHRIAHIHRQGDTRQQVVDLLWKLALRIEGGELSVAGNQLRDLQNALMQALRDGASDKEIADLTQALREALERYMQAMAEQALEDSNTQQFGDATSGSSVISRSDLEGLLDKIEQLSRSGARGAAQQMLSKLQSVLENMAPGQTAGGQNAKQKMVGDALKDLSGLMQEQQKLHDNTYNQRSQGGNSDGPGGLAREQDKLRGALEALNGRLEQESPGESPNSLGRAGDAMSEAAKSLRRGGTAHALEQQSQAMDQLRAGAGALAKILREEDARVRAENGDSQEAGPSHNGQDPLGRPVASDSGGATAVPEQFDIERALQIRRGLEVRASQRRRPAEELNYIDRLLKLF
ncbi:MAG: TIGR02302 family protein [Alphaproteobacteria bacterium]|nr:TIGR02302 family protein [Alphaproteobacteria bacterium]